MFKDETLFILGAGASCPYGYPIGEQLIDNIIRDIQNDSIYLHIPAEKMYQYEDNHASIPFKLKEIIDDLEHVSPEDFSREGALVLKTLKSFGGRSYAEVPLMKIEEFTNLCSALQQFDPVSIDSFLNKHPSYSCEGKIIIVYSLLKSENKSAVVRHAMHQDKPIDNW